MDPDTDGGTDKAENSAKGETDAVEETGWSAGRRSQI